MKPPKGYRLLRAGEVTRPGDIGVVDEKFGWTELKSGHVVHQRIVKAGRVARRTMRRD